MDNHFRHCGDQCSFTPGIVIKKHCFEWLIPMPGYIESDRTDTCLEFSFSEAISAVCTIQCALIGKSLDLLLGFCLQDAVKAAFKKLSENFIAIIRK